MRHRAPGGVIEYAIHDVYFDDEGRPTSWTEHARSPRLSSVSELRDWIEAQLSSPDTGVVCGDLGYEHHHEDFAVWRIHVGQPVIDAR